MNDLARGASSSLGGYMTGDTLRRGLLAVACSTIALACGSNTRGAAQVSVAFSSALTASDVTRVTVTVSGPGIDPAISTDLAKTSGKWSTVISNLPAGAGRTFH